MDLSLVSTPDLVEELGKRCQAAVFTSVDWDDNINVFLHGSALLCSGLLTNAGNEITWYSLQQHKDE